MSTSYWQTSRYQISLGRPQVMGIVNVTPDSFSDGGLHSGTRAALRHCEQLLKNGADILDIGGESTRPGARPVPVDQELARVLPIVREAVRMGVPVSVDTYKPAVMRAVLDVGADIINDVWALRWQDEASPAQTATAAVAGHPNCGVALMHMQGEPMTMQARPMEGDIITPVVEFLKKAADRLVALGVDKTRITLDPGVGFGKTVSQNFSLLARQSELVDLGYPLLVGWSRKSSLSAVVARSLGEVATLDIQARMVPSVAAALLAVAQGASVVRVHDVLETVSALKVWQAMQLQNKSLKI